APRERGRRCRRGQAADRRRRTPGGRRRPRPVRAQGAREDVPGAWPSRRGRGEGREHLSVRGGGGRMSYEKTSLPGGIPKLIQVWEPLRPNTQDGYIQHQGSLIARFRGDAHKFGKLITCSPFPGSAIGVAFDPNFPRGVGEAYEPMFNGGKDPLPFAKFYAMHNDKDQPAQSLPAFGLGELIDMKKMRRGRPGGSGLASPGGPCRC